MDNLRGLAVLLVLTPMGCADKSVKDTGDTAACPDLTGEPCSQSTYFICDECETVYSCARYNGYDLTWGWSDWACECVGDSGQLLEWNAETQTGNPSCVAWL